MNPSIKSKWVSALRSGEYKQTTAKLRGYDKFCCLGVLCNLHAQAHPKIAARQKSISSYMGQTEDLPKSVMKWAGLSMFDGAVVKYKNVTHSLVELNDIQQLNFKQIADIIEEQL
jgi:hypothetical protein